MYADKHTVVYPTKIKHKVFMVTCSLVEELKMKKKKIKKNRIYANLFAYKRVSDICKSDAQICTQASFRIYATRIYASDFAGPEHLHISEFHCSSSSSSSTSSSSFMVAVVVVVTVVAVVVVAVVIIIILVITLKGAIQDILQSPHRAANCLQHVSSNDEGARISGSFESVRWNACVHKLDLSLYSHPKEFLENTARNHVSSKGKTLFYQKLRGGLHPRRCITQDIEPNTLPTELFRPHTFLWATSKTFLLMCLHVVLLCNLISSVASCQLLASIPLQKH